MQHLSSKKKYEHLMHASEVFDGQNYQTPEALAALRGSDEVSADEMKRHLKNWSLIGAALRHELPARIDPNFADKVMARLAAEDDAPTAAWVPPQEQAWVPPLESESTEAEVAERDLELPTMLQGKWSQHAPSQQVVAHEYAALVTNMKAMQVDFDQAALNTQEHQPMKRSLKLTFKRVSSLLGQAAVAAAVAVVAVFGIQLYNASQPEFEEPVATTASTQVGPVTGLNLASYQNSDNDLLINPETVTQPQAQGSKNQDLSDAELRAEQQAELERINLYVQGYMLETAAN